MAIFNTGADWIRTAGKLVALALGTSLLASGPVWGQSGSEPVSPDTQSSLSDRPVILPLRERAEIIDQILQDRLDTLIPQLMREQDIQMWVLMAREYFEDPVVASMLDARSMAARRRTILVFFDPGEGQEIERLTVSRYGLAGLFEPAWDPDTQPDQWQAVADIIAARDPKTLAVNTSALSAFGDGMTQSQYQALMQVLPTRFQDRIVSGETLSIRWLETRTPAEMALYPDIVQIAHSILNRALSREAITPGVTTTEDLTWWYREELAALDLEPWFQPSVGVQRAGASGMLGGDTVIEPGDLIWTDLGLTYLRLNTDTQHLAYVLKPGETQAPQSLRDGLANSNRVQDILTAHFQTGLSGNEVLASARTQAIEEGFDPSIYTHPLGLHGHGAGPAIGFWDNQNADPRGAGLIQANTAWAIELTSYSRVPEWAGQRVDFRTEEDAFFDGETVRYLDGRQTEIILIPSSP